MTIVYRDAYGRFCQREAGVVSDQTGLPVRYALPAPLRLATLLRSMPLPIVPFRK